jgi:hypothetical protein
MRKPMPAVLKREFYSRVNSDLIGCARCGIPDISRAKCNLIHSRFSNPLKGAESFAVYRGNGQKKRRQCLYPTATGKKDGDLYGD